MASSSTSSSLLVHNDLSPSLKQKVQVLEEEEERDWLGLGLGFGKKQVLMTSSGASVSSFSLAPNSLQEEQVQPASHLKLGLGLGLGLGLDDDDEEEDDSGGYHDYGHENNMNMPSSLKSWPVLQLVQHADSNRNFLPSHYYHPDATKPPHSPGLWFSLRSSINRNGEELPQLPKAYIRVKEENMTVFMVKTYLVTKLGLSNEDEVDISCMGQKLLQSQTLKDVRDAIWFPGILFLLPKRSSTVDSRAAALLQNSQDLFVDYSLMSLHYARPCL